MPFKDNLKTIFFVLVCAIVLFMCGFCFGLYVTDKWTSFWLGYQLGSLDLWKLISGVFGL